MIPASALAESSGGQSPIERRKAMALEGVEGMGGGV